MVRHDTALLVNVCGETVDEYAEVARVCDGAPGIAGLEVNISCPNVEKGGMAFGGDPRLTHEVVAAVRKVTRLPVVPKLSPNVGDITVFARAAEEAGPTRSPASTPSSASPSMSRRGARGSGSAPGASPAPPSAPWPSGWRGRWRGR